MMSTNPGFVTRITSKGLNYANNVAIESLTKDVIGCVIPDFEDRSGDVKYEISSVNVTEFVKPNSSISLDAPNSLLWKANGANISGRGRWKYRFKHKWLPKVSDDGKFDINIRNLCFSVHIELGNDDTGRPTIKCKSSTCDIDKVDVTFHGGLAKIYNIFKGHLGHRLKHSFMDKMCHVLRRLIDVDASKSLAKVPVTIELDKVYMLDYRLVENPVFTSSFIETHHKGEVLWKDEVTESPHKAENLPSLNEDDRMIYFCISEYLFNTYLYQAHRNGKLKHVIKSEDLPENSRQALKTTSVEGLFIGLLIPQIATKYPDSELELHVSSKEVPKLSFQNGYIDLECNGEIEIHVTLPDNKSEYLLSMDGNMNVCVNVSVEDRKIVGRVGNLSIKTAITDTNIGFVSDEAIQFLIDYALRVHVEPMLNKQLKDGFLLPVSENISFENSKLAVTKDALTVGTDVTYTAD